MLGGLRDEDERRACLAQLLRYGKSSESGTDDHYLGPVDDGRLSLVCTTHAADTSTLKFLYDFKPRYLHPLESSNLGYSKNCYLFRS